MPVAEGSQVLGAECICLAVHQEGCPLTDRKGRRVVKKTGFLCTTAEARRELQKLRKDGDPAICDSMKDLGLDCALGRVRRVKVQRERHKAGQRQKKLKQLRVPGVPAKVRLFRGGVASVLAWGHQAQGMPPTRRQKLRTALAEQCGRQKMGNLEVALSSVGDRYQDPGRTMMVQGRPAGKNLGAYSPKAGRSQQPVANG